MRASSFDLDQALHNGYGVISRRQHPQLSGAIDWQLRQGRLRRVLPGVYARADDAERLEIRLTAAMAWRPDAVLVGAAAAKVSFWPTIALPVVTLAAGTAAARWLGFTSSERRIPAELVHLRGPLRYTDPALTALDLCDTVGGDGIDTALRARAATLDGMRAALALTGGRAGNLRRRELLLDSRDEPWSAAERLAHRLLRQARITGWVTNHPVELADRRYFVDIAFPGARLAIEIDGRLHHGLDQFERDRWRQNDLVGAGWTVLRFTWQMLVDHPDEVIDAIRGVLRRSALPAHR